MYSQMLCLNNWDAFHNPAEKDCSLRRRCGGDCEIFLESGWAAGAEHDVRVSWLTPWMASVGGPVMMRSTWPLSFRKSTVVASIRVRGGQPFLRGFYGNPTLRAMHSIHKCVAKDAPHLFHWRLSPYIVKNKNSDLWASSQIGVFVLTMHGS